MILAHALPSDLKRAWLLFLVVYVGINIPAVALYISVAALMSTPLSPPQTIMDDPAYRTTQQLYLLLNLALWMLARGVGMAARYRTDRWAVTGLLPPG